jgi:glucose-1-phosphate cytidylyltransferase
MGKNKSMSVVILCGGNGIRLEGEASYIPKGMVRVGQRPVIWHIMKRYSLFGYSKFILALGTKGEMIRDYFLNYESYTNDTEVTLGRGDVRHLTRNLESDWDITMVDTGEQASSGARIARCASYIDTDDFMMTYSDNVANIDFTKLLAFHRENKKIVTITGAIPPYREQEFQVKDGIAVGYFDAMKAKSQERYINGGFMVASKKLFSHLTTFNECRLESEVFGKLIEDRQLAVYSHHGFWRWLDTDRDHRYLNDLVDKNKMYWLQE